MKRRTAIRNVGLVAGGVFFLPYACVLPTPKVYSNFPLVLSEKQNLVSQICNVILEENSLEFLTPESRVEFVLTMINDCVTSKELAIFIGGLEAFETALSPTHELGYETLSQEEQIKFIGNQFEENTLVTDFLKLLKKYSLLHFETSEEYLTEYLNFEFMPGRYFGRVPIKTNS